MFLRRNRRPVTASASPSPASEGGSEPAQDAPTLAEQGVFRNYCIDDFWPHDSWRSLAQILEGNGGCFGLYGPRGSGKSWLMHRAIEEAESKGGLGLWFPCPRRYDASDFLLMLSDNLASAVERHLAKGKAVIAALTRGRNLIAMAVVALLAFALILHGAYGLVTQNGSGARHTSQFNEIFPVWLWICIITAAILSAIASFVVFTYNTTSKGSLLHEASALRERIRFTESLKLTASFGVSGSQGIVPSVNRARERTLNERPATDASLVFDFRNLAAHIVRQLKKPLVICVDELDKIEDTAEVRSLLRDIKGIFEVSETLFLVSISEEAAASLQIGALQPGGRNELNSSFYSVVAMSPLDPGEADRLLRGRGFGHATRLAAALCLFAGGNRRELVRMADTCSTYSRKREVPLDEYTIKGLLAEESFGLLQEITRSLPDPNQVDAEDVKYRAWTALRQEIFDTTEGFVELGTSAIHDLWEPHWVTDEWASVREPWRRLLIRLFVAARVLPPAADQAAACLLDDHDATLGLRDILVLATRDSNLARLMLLASFGSELSEHYRPFGPHPG